MIPPILHQSWKTKEPLPENFGFWRRSFLDLNPRFEHRLYDDRDNRQLVESTFPSLLPLYDGFPREIFRADFARLVYLFRFGGIYADMDFQCLQALDGAGLRNAEMAFGRMGTDRTAWHAIPNAFMASRPNEAFWIGYLAIIERSWQGKKAMSGVEDRPEWITGPVMLRQSIHLYREDRPSFRAVVRAFVARHRPEIRPDQLLEGKPALLPGHLLYPLNWQDRVHRRFLGELQANRTLLSLEEARDLFPDSLAVTYWAHSWTAPGSPPRAPASRKQAAALASIKNP